MAINLAREAVRANPQQADNIGGALAAEIAERMSLEPADRELVFQALSAAFEGYAEGMR